ncbi:probable strigolactone esterase DAD2, partial [Olea europaea var. sylvestris]|uniref:probable strigolactone esterase DAD2 n=1 Tax=Olea europaea var. sylvestris TaxID=158386 RepID=UPI000C1D7403
NYSYFTFDKTTLVDRTNSIISSLTTRSNHLSVLNIFRFLNDEDYHGGFEHGEIEKVLLAMKSNYEAWVNGFAPLSVGADVPVAVREFSLTLFNMRPDIALFVSHTVFSSDLRGVLGLVKVPCSIIQTAKDVSVPISVATYLKNQLGGHSTVLMLDTEGHLPHLSAPNMLVEKLRLALSG